jgi:hypothetical protein
MSKGAAHYLTKDGSSKTGKTELLLDDDDVCIDLTRQLNQRTPTLLPSYLRYPSCPTPEFHRMLAKN